MHFDLMAEFWQQCEVAKPNKLVPVPRKDIFNSFRKNKNVRNLEICLKKMQSATTNASSEETTSSGSGSQRSLEGKDEKTIQGTDAATAAAMRRNLTLGDRPKPDDGDCGSYLDSKYEKEVEEVAIAVAYPIAVIV
jgi:hypothetical protein